MKQLFQIMENEVTVIDGKLQSLIDVYHAFVAGGEGKQHKVLAGAGAGSSPAVRGDGRQFPHGGPLLGGAHSRHGVGKRHPQVRAGARD